MLTRQALLDFMRSHRYAVQASVSGDGKPQAALVGIAIADNFEIVFDTVDTTRKAVNLAANPRIALVIGGLEQSVEQTVQCEGLVVRPQGADLLAARELYFEVFPDGRERMNWPGIVHLLVRPTWLRYCDFRSVPPTIIELDSRGLMSLH